MQQLFAGVVNQPEAVNALRAAARRPLHAYLLTGPAGSGKRDAAVSFAAAALCPSGGDGTCDTCRRVLEGIHPDVTVFEREGAALSIDAALEITRLAARSPVEGERKFIILPDFHLVKDAGPALLKTIEEPPASTVFVVLAEAVPPELVTIASRCVQVQFRPLSEGDLAAALEAEGVPPQRAAAAAAAAGGRLDRARLLVEDPEMEERLAAWRSVPERLDGHGASAARLADEMVALLDGGVAPVRARQQQEVRSLEERNAKAAEVGGKLPGRRGTARAGVKELEEHHRRELRRLRTEELRAGLGVLARAYRDRAAAGGPSTSRALRAVALIQTAAANLVYNPGELLTLQALFVRLGRLQM